MNILPWRSVKNWICDRCGDCCRYAVQLTFNEWLTLTRQYGYIIANQQLGGFFLRKTIENKCPFLSKSYNTTQCSLQKIKPLACKIWPFRILTEPKYGEIDDALFTYRNMDFYIYAIPNCHGIMWGKPSELLIKKILPELIDIRLGVRRKQHFTTSF